MNVLVIGGGTSAERAVSLKSSQAVLSAAKTAGYQSQYYDWDGTKHWLLENAPTFDVILPILHGKGGEDGRIQAILEKTATPYLGSGVKTSQLCFDKSKTEAALQKLGVLVPRGELVTLEQYQKHPLFKEPHVLKPCAEGSSIDTFIYPAKSPTQHVNIVKHTFGKNQYMLLEEFIEGDEITVPILQGKTLPVIEIVPPAKETFSFENKYNGATKEFCPPKNVGRNLQQQAITLASEIHANLGCRHLSRTDMITRQGKLYVLEVNTMPGMTAQSLFPKAASAIGLDFTTLVDYFIKIAAEAV